MSALCASQFQWSPAVHPLQTTYIWIRVVQVVEQPCCCDLLSVIPPIRDVFFHLSPLFNNLLLERAWYPLTYSHLTTTNPSLPHTQHTPNNLCFHNTTYPSDPTPRRHSPVGKSRLGRRGAKQRRHASTLDAHLLTTLPYAPNKREQILK